jgi:anti-anti-sigma regulatory factor
MNTIILSERQTIENAQELKEDILVALDLPEPPIVDASEVAQIDTATLQLLAVLWRSSVRAGKPPRLERPSREFIRTAALLGLEGVFGLKPGASGLL